jgi:HAD superfamily phosphoserine phosphatase-like hydrolase
MRSLSTMLDALDQYSLETQRPITLPLLRDLLQAGSERTEAMNKLALFDLDHTLLPIDSDYEWGQFLVRIGAVDADAFERRNDDFFASTRPARWTRSNTWSSHSAPWRAFRAPSSMPARAVHGRSDRPGRSARPRCALVRKHIDAGDLVAIITATNHFVTAPIARALGVEHLIAAMPEIDADGNLTGKLVGTPTQGAGKVATPRPGWPAWARSWRLRARSHFYSDSHNDMPLMSVVTHPVATNPNAAAGNACSAHGWPILTYSMIKKLIRKILGKPKTASVRPTQPWSSARRNMASIRRTGHRTRSG